MVLKRQQQRRLQICRLIASEGLALLLRLQSDGLRGAAASASACREKLMEAAVQHSHCEKCADGTKWACSSRVPLSVCTSAGLSLLCELWCGRRVLRV